MKLVLRISAVLLLLCIALPAAAQSLDQAKAAGQVGERIDGFVGVVDANAPGDVRAMVDRVNAERRQKYAGIAAERATRSQVKAIGAALEAIARAAQAGRSAVDEDLAFHRAIAEATGNPEFPRFLQFIGRHLIPRRTVTGLPERMGGREAYLALIQEEHRRIHEAIRDRQPGAAREAMRRHLTRSLERYRKLAAERRQAV